MKEVALEQVGRERKEEPISHTLEALGKRVKVRGQCELVPEDCSSAKTGGRGRRGVAF